MYTEQVTESEKAIKKAKKCLSTARKCRELGMSKFYIESNLSMAKYWRQVAASHLNSETQLH